jgi:hypothetical protein
MIQFRAVYVDISDQSITSIGHYETTMETPHSLVSCPMVVVLPRHVDFGLLSIGIHDVTLVGDVVVDRKPIGTCLEDYMIRELAPIVLAYLEQILRFRLVLFDQDRSNMKTVYETILRWPGVLKSRICKLRPKIHNAIAGSRLLLIGETNCPVRVALATADLSLQ